MGKRSRLGPEWLIFISRCLMLLDFLKSLIYILFVGYLPDAIDLISKYFRSTALGINFLQFQIRLMQFFMMPPLELYCHNFFVSHVFRLFRRPIYLFSCPNSGTQKTLFKFSFFSCMSTENKMKCQSMISQCI